MDDSGLLIFILAVFLSYVYAFIGGFTDAANAIATAVGTGALKPTHAVLIAGVFELLGALSGTAVALTIGKGIASPEVLTQGAVVAALLGTMCWSLITYARGIPVSETHGLVGAIVGVGLFSAGPDAIEWSSLLTVMAAIFVSPALGALGAVVVLSACYHAARGVPRAKANRLFRRLQQLSAVFMAFSHGRNDAQKPMGILAMAIAIYHGQTALSVPLWVVLSVGVVAGFGVASGGWRIIRTLGVRVTGLATEQGFAAEASAATVLHLASNLGIPVSTTHLITSAIVGAGTVRGRKAVRWEVVGEIAVSWVLTLPATVLLGYLFAFIISSIG